LCYKHLCRISFPMLLPLHMNFNHEQNLTLVPSVACYLY
jgi:hypothetical protein